jgi:hypothetical protein
MKSTKQLTAMDHLSIKKRDNQNIVMPFIPAPSSQSLCSQLRTPCAQSISFFHSIQMQCQIDGPIPNSSSSVS